MPVFLLIIVAAGLAIALLVVGAKWRAAARAQHIRSFSFPPGLFDSLRKTHPELSLKDCQLVAQGLRQFFLAHLHSGRGFVAMPSQVADDLWHAFILHTRAYEQFCQQAFGRFMHHTPAVVLGRLGTSNDGLRRCWWHACKAENIHPRKPTRLPLLFALDTKLNIANGFHYLPDCQGFNQSRSQAGDNRERHCGADFSSTSFDGSVDGLGDAGDAGGAGDGGGGGGCGGD